VAVSAVIVGCGRIAGGFNDRDESRIQTHVAAYRRLGVTVAGCVDADAEIARAFAQRWSIANWGTELAPVIERARPDLVSLCTPPAPRPGLVDAVLRAAPIASFFLEKPLADTAEGARRILDRLKAAGVGAVVDYFRAFDPAYRCIEERVRSNAWGGLQCGTAHFYGELESNLPHWIERCLAMFGQPDRVRRLDGSAGDAGFALSFAGRPIRFLPCADLGYAPFELDLMFERARLRIVDSEERSELYESRPHPHFPGYSVLSRVADDSLNPSHESLLDAARAALAIAAARSGDTSSVRRAVDVAEVLDALVPRNTPPANR
jgi:hypothetical protein